MNNGFFSDVNKNGYVKNYLEKNLAQYGKLKYVYAVMNKINTDKMIIISDLPESLVLNYLNKKNQRIDPVVINALNRVSSFSWDENMTINSRWTMKRVFESVKQHNIISGYAFVLHDHKNNLALLSLYIDKYLMENAAEIIMKNNSALQSLLITSHEMLINSYNCSDEKHFKEITPREAEILYWCSTGKTYLEIADLLHISDRTVKFHMANIIKKMGVRNSKQAISLSTELNIAILPQEICSKFPNKINNI